jgi:hypothetical protein
MGAVKLALVLLVPLLVFCGWQFQRRQQNENRLALVASEIARRDVDVSCPGFWKRMVEITPNAGWVDFDEHGRPSDRTSLSASTCKSLERVWRGKQRAFGCFIRARCDEDTLRAAFGIVTLAHESWHLRGVMDEGQTQCYAVQTVEQAARALGVLPVDAHLLALRVAIDDAAAPRGEYHSDDCHPGGEFDLHPATPAWPTG